MRPTRKLTALLATCAISMASASAQSGYDNDFEIDDAGWNVFGAGFDSVRVASGTNSITSAGGSWHCETIGAAAGNWGGYSGNTGCASSTCAGPISVFPLGGYVTSIDIYIDLTGGWADDTRFDFSSAINNTSGTHLRDFVFTGQFLLAANPALPGTGTDRFLFAASNNTPGWPAGGISPVAITTSGWYTFENRFYDSGAGVLACDFVILDSASSVVASWTRSEPTDIIGSVVGGNRYAWFVTNGFPFLAFDNASRTAGPFDQDVTPDVIFGSGNANGSFTVDQQDSVELGLRGKLRFDPSNLPANIFNSNGDGTYTFSTGAPTGGAGWVAATTPIWNFEWSVNTDYDTSSGLFLDDLTYELGLDFDSSSSTNYLAFDQITPGLVTVWDHAIGTNATGNGGGTVYSTAPTYLAALGANNVAQNSWNMEFFNDPPFDVFDPDVPGEYQFYLAAFDGGTEVARSAITIYAMDGMTLSLEGDPCQTDQDAGLAGIQVEVELWMRNPDDMPTTGYQAFLSYDALEMTYEGTTSAYSLSPFEAHIQAIGTANVATNELRLDGNTSGAAYTGDALLATLVFTVDECDLNTVSFDLGQPFDSEVSYSGTPYVTDLLDSDDVQGDITAPVLAGTPADFSQPADAGSCTEAVVTWTDPTATDNCDPSPTVVCSPASGSTFLVGTTTVTCTATDACGNESTSTFDVTITATNTVTLDVQLVGSGPIAASRCIHFVMTDDCGVTADITLAFDGTGLFSGDIEVPCGVWTGICAKDRQHTEWDSTTLTDMGANYVAGATLNLEGGDTDDDGDVDINDVTLFLVQFGTGPFAGGCPWDGTTRDADFSNNGAIGSEDYTFLVNNWLTLSTCACTTPLTGGSGIRLGDLRRKLPTTAKNSAADLTDDGWIDWRDVAVFERQNGLPSALSSVMRSPR